MHTEADYQEIENVLEEILGDRVGFGEMVDGMMQGGNVWSAKHWLTLLKDVFTGQLQTHGEAITYLILLLISAAVLSTIAKAFKNRQISDMGFFMIYLLLFLILFRSFGTCYTLTETVVRDLMDFMRVLMPAYFMAVAAGAYQTTAVVYYEGFFFMIYYVHKFVFYVLMPAIRCYVLLTMLGYLGEEDFLKRGREGLKKMILFLLKTMVGIVVGMQMIQGMITPAVDEVKQTAISRGIQSLGSVGNVAQNVTDVFLGSSMLLKNGIGVAAAVTIVTICLIPVIQVLGYMLFYQVMAAASEPVSDKRLTGAIGQMGEGMGLLVKLLFAVSMMFLLTIAIVCVTTGGML